MEENNSNENFVREAGYAHRRYAASFSEFGEPRHLPRSRTWILERRIPGSDLRDAMGCYPLFTCGDWRRLPEDLAELEAEGRLVSFAAVLDPFAEVDSDFLATCFPDRAIPFKSHFVIDLSRPLESRLSTHHQRKLRAAQEVEVEISANPASWLADWERLYGFLIERHQIRDLRAFSSRAFAEQFAVPGITAFRALSDGALAGMILWYDAGDVVYYHLGAYAPIGYQTGASYALFRAATNHFAQRGLKWANLGAGAGAMESDDGLTRFKRGWSTGSRTAHFCGRILNRPLYAELARLHGSPGASYFPAYREGEFCKKKPVPPTT